MNESSSSPHCSHLSAGEVWSVAKLWCMSGFARFTVTAPGPFLDLSLTLLLIMDLSSQFGTVPVQFPCKTMMRTPQSLGLLPRFMFHGSKIDVYSHEKEALLSRYSWVQITVVISTHPFTEEPMLRLRIIRFTIRLRKRCSLLKNSE